MMNEDADPTTPASGGGITPAAADPMPSAPADPRDRHISPYTLKQKIARVLWHVAQGTLFGLSPQPAYAWRAMILRAFGARLGRNVRVRRSVSVEIPWNLSIGDDTSVGDRAILYCLGPVTIGKLVTISQYAHLCAGTHDYRSPLMPLVRSPISIGDECWIGADAFVGPGVTIGHRAILGARASAFKDIAPGVIAGGNPAKMIKMRDA
jgi:putative colanic acid biosynthesis acetyltransferase WcaF